MINDPIVQTVRTIRDDLARAFHYDIHAIFADLRNRESFHGDRLIEQEVNVQSKDPSLQTNLEVEIEKPTPIGRAKF